MNHTDSKQATNTEESQELWCHSTAHMLRQMIKLAGYPSPVEESHMAFYKTIVCHSFGSHPAKISKQPVFKSYMNDDHTPIELSWSWTKGTRLPKIRYSIEPIGKYAGTEKDPFNSVTPDDFMRELKTKGVDVNLELYEHFSTALTPKSKAEMSVSRSTDASSKFIALELAQDGSLSTKVYFMPPKDELNQFQAIVDAVKSFPIADASLLRNLDRVANFISTFPSDSSLQAPMLAVDCIDPSLARIKIYIRTPETSFNSVVKMMEIPGQRLSGKQHAALGELYRTVLGLSEDVKDSDDLPEIKHKTAGMIYHYDLRLSSDAMRVKMYIPVKHYGTNDLQIARNFSKWLEKQGWGLQDSSYLEATEAMCMHRSLEDGLGLQTYISATFDGEDLAVTAYLQPEIYHPMRKW